MIGGIYMVFSNADKSRHGKSAQCSLAAILERNVELGYISEFKSEYRIGRKGFSNSKQFYAPFLITFKDNTAWALFTTTSMRTDRVKGQQWDAINLKALNTNISQVYLVYPDGISRKEESQFLKQYSKFINKEEYSAIDAIVSQDKLNNMIEEYAIKDKNSGQKKDIQGNSFENRTAVVLSFAKNLQKWKENDLTMEGMHFDMFQRIVECFNLDKSSVKSIEATSDKTIIGKLPSGGNPKTDILITVHYNDNSTDTYTISCKRSSSNSVSVHQYNANTFSNVLNPNDATLRKLLNQFQIYGNMRDFGVANCIALEKALTPYLEKLSMWVLGGFGGEGNKCQCASYILTYDNQTNTSSIHEIHDYYHILIDAGVKGHFGTLFSWTYPSKRKGKDIQLKCKIVK